MVVEIQSETTFLSITRILSDGVVQNYLFVHTRLSATVSINEKASFEAASMTVMCGTGTKTQSAKLKFSSPPPHRIYY